MTVESISFVEFHQTDRLPTSDRSQRLNIVLCQTISAIGSGASDRHGRNLTKTILRKYVDGLPDLNVRPVPWLSIGLGFLERCGRSSERPLASKLSISTRLTRLVNSFFVYIVGLAPETVVTAPVSIAHFSLAEIL